MLWKLSLTGIKGRLKDYIVLFSGLVMASAIFYMFQSMASNEEFLKNNSTIGVVVIIFHFGTVLLGIITFAYILYANSFLMSMRQKDYAMFMMLGAKGRKIAQMIFIETFFVGIIATITGALAGIGLTKIVNDLLVQQLNIKITHFSPFNVKALVITLVFFAILFLIAAIVNASAIAKKAILDLLRETSTPAQIKQKFPFLLVQTLLGIIFLGIGYYVMSDLMKFQIMGIAIALVTIVLGTYLVFRSVIVLILTLLKKSDAIALKKLNNFTLSQLNFRIRDYTQMLSLVSMLFALALGALTVGLGFRNEIPKMAKAMTSYDLVLNNAQTVDQQKIADLHPTLNVRYRQKEDDTAVYYIQEEFDKDPLIVTEQGDLSQRDGYRSLNGQAIAADLAEQDQLRSFELPEQRGKEVKLLSANAFEQVNAPETILQVIQVKDFEAVLPKLTALAKLDQKNNPSLAGESNLMQRADAYDTFNGIFSGFEFMGFFLGIAFLTMLASCLMFKILSGANSDIMRYTMLRKIGARNGLLKKSIRKEIGVLFLVPGLLGIVHVLFGLQMFKMLLSDPYDQIWLPFAIFVALYAVYYLLTVWLYNNIVLKNTGKQ
ncbi:FtsX-like permease family protein [Enterococcus gallinarum]|uniref:FtsX-like permease family protein n=1 Tax=Enterococcus gallinarum TaxID=1353 RepID=UPI0022E14A04|nr:ABC transporter permease [Enterococcus gallinarum]